MGIRLKENYNYRLDITIAFILYAFLIVLSIGVVGSFYLSRQNTDEFQQNVLLSSKNIEYIFYQKQKILKQTTKGIVKSVISGDFVVNEHILKTIFKAFLVSNDDFVNILYKNKNKILICAKQNNYVFCGNHTNIRYPLISLTQKFVLNKTKSISITSNLQKFLDMIPKDAFNILLVGKNGKILYSSFIKASSIFDLFAQNISQNILKKNKGFITNDIYVDKLGKYKIVFVQNKKLLNQQKQVAKRVMVVIFVFAFLIAVPFGYFFSKPLYEFYDELDTKVKEELEKNREKEQLLMHQSKLASLGEMLGNIAHQWRHPITNLSLLVQNLSIAYERGKLDDDRMKKFHKKSLEQIEYMSKTIDDFTSFFKKDKQKQKFFVRDVIEDTLKLLESRIKDVEIVKNYQDRVFIEGYKTEFSQVILNIINNAIDALNERKVAKKKIFVFISKEKIEIGDNAGGISDEIIDKIFEPYFTTKFQSQGTGIGLYMSKVIINKHFGTNLEVYNSKNGAVFKIALF